jgi:hypothetical protein
MADNESPLVLPGMEDMFENEADEDFVEDLPGAFIRRYHDTTAFPDAAGDQLRDNGSYILYITFPNRELFAEGVLALTNGERKTLVAGSMLASIDAVHQGRRGRPLLDIWKEKMLPKEKSNG